jgi:hypothetical protein
LVGVLVGAKKKAILELKTVGKNQANVLSNNSC